MSVPAEESELVSVLREIRDNQRESIELQRAHIAMYQHHLGRIERINDRAEAIQGRAGKAARLILWIALPLVAVLLLLMFWPYLHHLVA